MITIKHYENGPDQPARTVTVKNLLTYVSQITLHPDVGIFEDSPCETNDITSALMDEAMLYKEGCGELNLWVKSSGCYVITRTYNGGIAKAFNKVVSFILKPIIKLFTPDLPEAPDQTDPTSPTNAQEKIPNRARPNARTPDVWGRVNKHVPDSIHSGSETYSIFENNQEVQNTTLLISEGEGVTENWEVSGSPVTDVSGSKVNVFAPNKSFNAGDPPDLIVGGQINRRVINFRAEKGLDGSELLPPNSLEGEGIRWTMTGSAGQTTGLLEANPSSITFSLLDFFSIGDALTIESATAGFDPINLTLYAAGVPSWNAALYEEGFIDSEEYIITGVTETTLTLDISNTGATIISYWQRSSGWEILRDYWINFRNFPGVIVYQTDDQRADGSVQWYEDAALTQPIFFEARSNQVIVGQAFDGRVGPFYVPNSATSIIINVVASGGFYKLVSNKEERVESGIEIVAEELDSNRMPTGLVQVINRDFASNDVSITAQAASTWEITRAEMWPMTRVFARRTGERDERTNVSNVDRAIWRDLYYVEDIGDINFGDCTHAQVQVSSSSTATQINQPDVTCDFTRSIYKYLGNGQFDTARTPLSNISDVASNLCLDEYNGRLTLDNFDPDNFAEVEAEIVQYFQTEDAAEIGIVIDDASTRFQDTMRQIWQSRLCEPYTLNGKYLVYPDILREESTKQFTHRNKILGTSQRDRNFARESLYDGVKVTYRDNGTGEFLDIELWVDGVDGSNPKSVNPIGCVTASMANKIANRELNIIKYNRATISFEADSVAFVTVIGERVDNVDNTLIGRDSYGVVGGKVMQQDGTRILLSEPVKFFDGDTHSIRFTARNGQISEAINVTAGAFAREVILSQLPSIEIYTGHRAEQTTFTFAPDNQRESMPILIRDNKSGNKTTYRTRKLSAINWDARYYQGDFS